MQKVDYGFDAPGLILGLAVCGVAALALAVWLPLAPALDWYWRPWLIWGGVPLLLNSLLMVIYSKIGKYPWRDRLIGFVDWRGDEAVLDVGTGRGLLLNAAAKKVTRGKAVGIDIWSAKDMSNNSAAETRRNAEMEGVAERVEVVSADASKMPFANSSFDVIVSNLCLHNIPLTPDREKAVKEIARVLRPGGTAVIADLMYTRDYARIFKEQGLQVERLGPFFFSTFPPLTVVRAHRPS